MLTKLGIIYLEAELGCRDLYASFTTMSTPPTPKSEECNLERYLRTIHKLRKVGIANAALESL